MTETMTLTEQERKEGDSLIALYNKLVERNTKVRNTKKDLEEIIMAFYSVHKNNGDSVSQRLHRSIILFRQFQKQLQTVHFAAEEDFHNPLVSPMERVDKRDQRLKDIASRLSKQTQKTPDVPELLDTLGLTAAQDPQLAQKTATILSQYSQSITNISLALKTLQKKLRDELSTVCEESEANRKAAYSTLKIWAQESEPRQEYLKSQGIHIEPAQKVVPKASSSPAAIVVSNRRKKKDNQVSKETTSGTPAPIANPWIVHVVNPRRTKILGKITLQDADDYTNLNTTLQENLNWIANNAQLSLALNRLLNTPPENRAVELKLCVVPGQQYVWYSETVNGKYRLLVNFDDTNKVIVMTAGIRKDIYHQTGIQHKKS